MKDQNNQSNQINQELDSNFAELQDQMQGNNEEEQNEDGIRNVINNFESNENASTENDTETRKNRTAKNEQKKIKKTYQSKPLPDVKLESSKNFIDKDRLYEQNIQSNYNAILVDIIRLNGYKRLAVYQDQIEFNLHVYEVTIGEDSEEEVNWFFPNRFSAFSYVYNYFRKKYALNLRGL